MLCHKYVSTIQYTITNNDLHEKDIYDALDHRAIEERNIV